jgi:hypothetical protein
MAHELYHIVGQTHDHARSGVAEPSFTVAELLSDHFEFNQNTLGELHATPDVAVSFERTYAEDVSGK